MPLDEFLDVVHDSGAARWSNWHQNFEQTPLYKFYDLWNANPDISSLGGYKHTTRALQQITVDALQQDRSVRALGGGWSFTPVAATDGIMLNTRPLNYRFTLDADQIAPNYPGRGTLLFVQCGISIAELNRFLASNNLALRTSGASNGQTIAGALSTGTHGAALAVGAVPEYVVAIHLVTGPGKTVWLERQSYPVVQPSVVQALDATAKLNDDLFNAAVVSFGSFGIIHGVVIEVDRLYYLNAWRKRIPLDQKLWDAIARGDFSTVNLPGANGRRPYHFQIVVNPYDQKPGAFATVMYRENAPPRGSKPADPFSRVAQGDGALELIGRLTDFTGDITADLTNLLVKIGYGEYNNVSGIPGYIFSDTTTRGHAASSAMGMALRDLQKAMAIATDEVQKAQAPALVAVRLVKSSQATLSFTCHGAVTGVLEIDGPDSNRVRAAYRAVWQRLKQENITYTFHWGKLNNLDAPSVRAMYGPSLAKWSLARDALLPSRELRRLFANDFVHQLELSD